MLKSKMKAGTNLINKPGRIVFSTLGILIVIFAFLLDRFGLGRPGNFGIGQFLLLLVGVFTFLTGLLGRKIIKLYNGMAVILLNTLILIAFVELLAIVIARSSQNYNADIQSLPYYATKEWTETYFREAFQAEQFRYEPFVVWRHTPLSGTTMNLNQEGFRKTPGAECVDGAYKVFVMGGSTILGWGSPDWGTIPAYLQVGLEERKDKPVCVVNLGQSGYVSTQSLLTLMFELRRQNIPDLVIFYDGVNEAQAAYTSGKAGGHVTQEPIAARFEEREHPLIRFVKSSRTYALIERWAKAKTLENADEDRVINTIWSEGVTINELSDSVSEVYLGNYRFVSLLGKEYGFDFFFFLQPHLAVDKKSLTEEEQAIKSKMDLRLLDLTSAIYQKISNEVENKNIWNIADVFEGHDEQIWIDTGGHVTPDGNHLVALGMLDIIENDLK